MLVAHTGRVCRQGLFAAPLIVVSVALTPAASQAAGYDFTTIVDSTSGLNPDFNSHGQRKINDNGEVTFLATPSFATYRIYKGSGGALTQISGLFGMNRPSNGAIANSGEVVFTAAPESFSNGIYRGSGGAITTVVTGDQNTNTVGTKRAFFATSVSNSGLIAYQGNWQVCSGNPVSCTSAVNGYYALSGQSIVTLAEEGGVWQASRTYAPVINDAGQVIFTMSSAVDGNTHLLRYDGGSLTTIDNDFSGSKGYSMNNAGDIATAEGSAVTVYSNGVTTTFASTADGFASLMKVGTGEVSINDSGQIAFYGRVSQFAGNPVNWNGVYTGPDIANDRVLVWGDNLFGHTIGDIQLLGLNNAGQMLLSVAAQGGNPWRALVVATPTPAPELPGDFNDDHVVDAADYVLWRKNVGTSNPLPNDPHGGIIGPDQYGTWRDHFGQTLGNAAVNSIHQSAVPEPGALALLVFSSLGIMLTARHRSKWSK